MSVLVAAAASDHGGAAITIAHTEVKIPRLLLTPKLEDFLSMHPDARIAGTMARIDGFVQSDPDHGSLASGKADVYVGYDAKALYLVWVCWDHQPYPVRAHISAREDVWGDDTVDLLLDASHDRRRGYASATNPYGIHWDAIYIEGRGSDSSLDTSWNSRGKLTAQGYVVQVAIPFANLRLCESSRL